MEKSINYKRISPPVNRELSSNHARLSPSRQAGGFVRLKRSGGIGRRYWLSGQGSKRKPIRCQGSRLAILESIHGTANCNDANSMQGANPCLRLNRLVLKVCAQSLIRLGYVLDRASQYINEWRVYEHINTHAR